MHFPLTVAGSLRWKKTSTLLTANFWQNLDFDDKFLTQNIDFDDKFLTKPRLIKNSFKIIQVSFHWVVYRPMKGNRSVKEYRKIVLLLYPQLGWKLAISIVGLVCQGIYWEKWCKEWPTLFTLKSIDLDFWENKIIYVYSFQVGLSSKFVSGRYILFIL